MSEPVLEFRDVSKTFRVRRGVAGSVAQTPALRHVSFRLHSREVLALVGESGAGKSTTARMALGLEKPDEGSVLFEGVDMHALSAWRRRELRRRTHLIFQDPYQALHPAMSVARVVAEPLAIAGVPRREHRRRVEQALADVQLTPPAAFAERYPHQLSGGQRQRVAFARAIVGGPDLVVADEPVSMLDVSLQAGILDLVDQLRARQAVVFITHDLAVARRVADRIAVMYAGRIVEIGPAADVVDHPKHPYTAALLAAVEELAPPPPAHEPFPPGGQPCELHGTCEPQRRECLQAEPVLVPAAGPHRCAWHITGDSGVAAPCTGDNGSAPDRQQGA